MSNTVDVLDHGYVRLRQHMGDDLTIVNAARVSYDKHSDWDRIETIVGYEPKYSPYGDMPIVEYTYQLPPKDERLLRYLLEHGHTSPLRHSVLTYEIYMPLMVARQWSKYRVGCTWLFEDSDDPVETWNESSRRYVTEEPVFYTPDEWRSAPDNSKQGSGGPVGDSYMQQAVRDTLIDDTKRSLLRYQEALDLGVCAEQARLFLPAYAMYVRAWWTVSLQGVVHFLQQRLDSHAQYEIQVFAQAVRDLTEPLFPKTFELLGLGEEPNESPA